MSFREKSAWAMGALVLVTGLFWLRLALSLPRDTPALVHVGPLIPYMIAVIILSIAVQVALAVVSPKDAERPADERERIVIDRAGNWSGAVLGVAVVTSVLHYFWYDQGDLLLWVVGGLILSQIAEYAFQIMLFRKGV